MYLFPQHCSGVAIVTSIVAPLKSLPLNISMALAADSGFSYVTVAQPVGCFCLSIKTKMRCTPEHVCVKKLHTKKGLQLTWKLTFCD